MKDTSEEHYKQPLPGNLLALRKATDGSSVAATVFLFLKTIIVLLCAVV